MELIFETRPDILKVTEHLHFLQCKPKITDEPVLVGDTPVDSKGAYLYGSVLYDQGLYRMWYQAAPEKGSTHDVPLVAYAESHDGIQWNKRNLNLVEWQGSKNNNLCNLGFHCPSIYIDPKAPPERRYQATGCIDSRYTGYHLDAEPPRGGGYYTAFSKDGFDWNLDFKHPRWDSADNIYTIYHPGRDYIQTLMKVNRRYGGIARRMWWETQYINQSWTPRYLAISADEFEDICAINKGYRSGDYNGISLMPAGKSSVGFIQTHRNRLPRCPHPNGKDISMHGVLDLTLIFQYDHHHLWTHPHGRPTFVSHQQKEWLSGCIFSGSNVENFGDEQRLYISGTPNTHGSGSFGDNLKLSTGYCSWPKWRLFGYEADPEGIIEIELPEFDEESYLFLNYSTKDNGYISVQLHTLEPYHRLQDISTFCEDYLFENAIKMNGDSLYQKVMWKNKSSISPIPGRRIVACIQMKHASLFAFELKKVNE